VPQRSARQLPSARPSRRDRTRGCNQPRRPAPAEPAASADAPTAAPRRGRGFHDE
jgi:hypothetical protein